MVWRFEPPPGWPPPPTGFVPPKDWRPDPSWPAAPNDWTFWIWDATEPVSLPPPPSSETPSTATVQDRVPGPPQTPSEMPDQAMVQDRVARVGMVTETGSEHRSWRVRRQERHAAKEQTHEVAVWQADQDFADEVAAVARATHKGLTTLPGLLLKAGELPFWSATAALIEPRVQQGHFVGKSTGVSLHVAKGVNYRVGGMRGHYVPGPEVQTPVDRGQVFVTSQRVVFEGSRTTREWLFTKLLGAEASSDDHVVLLHVSNRQKVSGLALGQLGARFQAYLALGVAAGQDGGAAVAQRWSESAEAHRGQKPG